MSEVFNATVESRSGGGSDALNRRQIFNTFKDNPKLQPHSSPSIESLQSPSQMNEFNSPHKHG
jgi:hypothetical protein